MDGTIDDKDNNNNQRLHRIREKGRTGKRKWTVRRSREGAKERVQDIYEKNQTRKDCCDFGTNSVCYCFTLFYFTGQVLLFTSCLILDEER